MAAKPRVIILRTAGTNCDQETAFAFESCGADAHLVHINRLFEGKCKLADYHILAIPGGFTYGDDIMAGRILANELRLRLGEDIRKFIADGKLILGICNGFQVLVRSGFLPGPLNGASSTDEIQTVTLTNNDSGKFEDRWIYLKSSGNSVWTVDLGATIFLPVAHAEGKFVPKDKEVLSRLRQNNQIIFRYSDTAGNVCGSYPLNPNGSVDNIAGISDMSGRILGMMPHPERHFLFNHHPYWTRLKRKKCGQGARIFENGIKYVKKNLL